MNEYNEIENYGMASSVNQIQQTTGKMERVGNIAAPYLTSGFKTQDNFLYDNYARMKKVEGVMGCIAGDYYGSQARSAYQRINTQEVGTAESEYLSKLGFHEAKASEFDVEVTDLSTNTQTTLTMTKEDLTSNQLSSLRQKGTFSDTDKILNINDKDIFNSIINKDYKAQETASALIGVTSRKGQEHVMQEMYQRGIDSMQNSPNLVNIYQAKQYGSDAVRSELAKSQQIVDAKINDILPICNNKNNLDRLLNSSTYTEAQLSQINRLINSDKALSTDQKNSLKQCIADKNEMNLFSNTVKAGGNANKSKSRQAGGTRMVTSKLLGNDMRMGIDLAKGSYKVSRMAAKSTLSSARKIGYGTTKASLHVASGTTKLVDKAFAKNTNSVIKSAQSGVNDIQLRGSQRRMAKKNNEMQKYNAKRRQERFDKRDAKWDRKKTRNDTELSKARKDKNSKLEQKAKRRSSRYDRKQTRQFNKRDQYSQRLKRKTNRINRRNTVRNKITSPFKSLAKPFNAVSELIGKIKKKLFKGFVIIPAGVMLILVGSTVLSIIAYGVPIAIIENVIGDDDDENGIDVDAESPSGVTDEKIQALINRLKEQNPDVPEYRWAMIEKGASLIGITQYKCPPPPEDRTAECPKYLDCSAFVTWVYNYGLNLKKRILTDCEWTGSIVARSNYVYNGQSYGGKTFKAVSHDKLQVGDIGLNNGSQAQKAQNHTGIYAGVLDGQDIWLHCTSSECTLGGMTIHTGPRFGPHDNFAVYLHPRAFDSIKDMDLDDLNEVDLKDVKVK